MIVFRYDKTLEGLFTAIFDAYARRLFTDRLLDAEEPAPMFVSQSYTVVTDPARAARVWEGIGKKAGRKICNMLLYVWLSEEAGCDELIFRYVRKTIDSPCPIAGNFADPDVADADKTARRVSQEGERVRQFIRFQKAADGSYFAPVAPKFNALPLAVGYLEDRFADQRWLVYDTKRGYGYYYDLETVREVSLEDDALLSGGKLAPGIIDGDEEMYQAMWRDYFKALTIKERINPKLHRRNMPRRFWKYLPEKQ